MAYRFNINGKPYEVEISSLGSEKAEVKVNGKDYEVELEKARAETEDKEETRIVADRPSIAAVPESPAGKTVRSPLPGVLLQVYVREGQNVKRGEKIAVLEAMKMENEILSPADGIIAEVNVSKGDSVLEGAIIAKIA